MALSIGGSLTSYGELARFAGRVASWLLRSSLEGNVGIYAHRSSTAYAGVLGACIAGRPWVPIGVDLPVERQVELSCRIPGEYSGPASRAYLEADADHTAWAEPLRVRIGPKK